MIIAAPIGGYGNHLRLLILISLRSTLTKEIILEKIYPDNRTWHNWLMFEWKFRNVLNKQILLTHDEVNEEVISLLVLISNPELCYHHYLKVNSSFNNNGIPNFFNDINSFNNFYQNRTNRNNLKLINSYNLYSENLDKDLYCSLIDFLKIKNNNYDIAKDIHAKWYQLVIKSEKDFLNHVNSIYKNNFTNEISDKIQKYLNQIENPV